jgi:murein DD-endopeptidase MepM/ murein hydrolase activator NlpD
LRALLLAVLLIVLVAGVGAFWTGAAPRVAVTPKLPGIGKRTPIQIKIEDPQRVSKVKVEVVQPGTDPKPVLEREFQPRPAWQFWNSPAPVELGVDVGRETVQGLRTGKATVRVTAERAGTWLRHPDPVVSEVELPVRLSPPSLGLVSTFHYAKQGGSEAVVYRVGEGAVRDGVQAGKWWFPGFPMPGGDKQQRFALFAVPYDMDDPSGVRLVAIDEVGNRAEVGFIDQFTPRPIRTDTIDVNDKFLNRVVPEIMAQSSEVEDRGNLLENYLQINRELRRKNAQTLKELAAKSPRKFLWTQPFIPMPNAQITAAFADRRTYIYNGKAIDQQDHLGFDMASVERDAIPASNSGHVVLARYFGIYGNAVVIDHGYGLMSLYGHLSSIGVQEGQDVQRGQELGRSGQTGLAGGDHLHFTLLLQGLPVSPVEWWDPHWIQDRVARKLGPALAYQEKAAAPAAPATPATPSAPSTPPR